MRLRTLIIPITLGLAARAVLRHRRDQRARRATDDARARRADSLASDPGDPVQGLDELPELLVVPLEVDVQPIDDAETAQDLAGLESDIDRIAGDDDAVIELVDVHVAAEARVTAELYGANAPLAVDRAYPDDDAAQADGQTSDGQTWDGQTWIEALETSAIENGADPERELSDIVVDNVDETVDEIVDDEDVLLTPHPGNRRDTPIADFGSGGRRGL